MIVIKNLVKKYNTTDETIIPVNDLNFSVNDYEFISLMGRSGAGKTTILSLLAGIITPDSGKIFIDDIELSSLGDRERAVFRRENIGMVFQDYLLDESLTVYQNIEVSLMISGISKKQRIELIENSLERTGLIEKKNEKVMHLSGGEKQRTGIARAIVKKPKYILADEPCGNLDEDNTYQMLNMLKGFSTSKEASVIMVTHNPADAEFTDRILYLKDGKITGQK